jgi:hypothetical protein
VTVAIEKSCTDWNTAFRETGSRFFDCNAQHIAELERRHLRDRRAPNIIAQPARITNAPMMVHFV